MPTPSAFMPTLLSQALTAPLTPWTPHASQQSHEPTGRLTDPLRPSQTPCRAFRALRVHAASLIGHLEPLTSS